VPFAVAAKVAEERQNTTPKRRKVPGDYGCYKQITWKPSEGIYKHWSHRRYRHVFLAMDHLLSKLVGMAGDHTNAIGRDYDQNLGRRDGSA
jgi:hypothetical protein